MSRDEENNKAIQRLSSEIVESRIIAERMEGKLDRIRDSQKITDEKVEAILDVVTGHISGAKTGLVIRVHDLEQKQAETEKRIEDNLRMNGKITNMEKNLNEVLEMQRKHPSLLYSLRFETRKTIMWIIFFLMLVSIWFVSGLRQPILEFFGLPIF